MNKDLQSLYSVLGEVKVAIVSEITKMNEKVEIVTLPYEYVNPKGEFVLVVENKVEQQVKVTDELLLKEMKDLLKSNDKQTTFKLLKEKYNLTKSYVYNLYESNKK